MDTTPTPGPAPGNGAPAPASPEVEQVRSKATTEPPRRIEKLVRDFFISREVWEFASEGPDADLDPNPDQDRHFAISDACLLADPENLRECEALLRVARQVIETHFGSENWPGAVIHLLDSLESDLSGLIIEKKDRIKLDATGAEPSVSTRIDAARDILARFGMGEPYLAKARALLGRIAGVVAAAEDRFRDQFWAHRRAAQ